MKGKPFYLELLKIVESYEELRYDLADEDETTAFDHTELVKLDKIKHELAARLGLKK